MAYHIFFKKKQAILIDFPGIVFFSVHENFRKSLNVGKIVLHETFSRFIERLWFIVALRSEIIVL